MTCLTPTSLISRLARGGSGLSRCLSLLVIVHSAPFLRSTSACSYLLFRLLFAVCATRRSPLDRFDRSQPPRGRYPGRSTCAFGSTCGRDEHLLHREAGSAVAGCQVAAIEKRDLQEVPLPARFLLRRTSNSGRPPPGLLVAAASLSRSPHCASPLVKATWRGSLNP